MSIDLIRTAYTKQVDAKLQRVLVLLCDFANDAGVCWPSLDRIAWKLGVSRRTVIRAIHDLERLGALEIRRTHRKVNVYVISMGVLPDKPPFEESLGDKLNTSLLGDKLTIGPDRMSPKNGQNVTHMGDKTSPQPPDEPSTEPPGTTTTGVGPKGSDPQPKTPSGRPEPTPARTERQQRADRAYERRLLLFGAWCRGVGLDPDGEEALLGRTIAFRHLKPLIDSSFPTAQELESCTRWLTGQSWRDTAPTISTVIRELPGWAARGKPAGPGPVRTDGERGLEDDNRRYLEEQAAAGDLRAKAALARYRDGDL